MNDDAQTAPAHQPEQTPKQSPLTLFQSARPVTRAGTLHDALAGIELAAMNIPQALGYARIAGTPVVTGIYTLLFPLIAYAAFGSSRYLVVAADSATAAIVAGGVSPMAPAGSPRYVALAGMVALLTAGFLLVARVLKLGFLADFLSQTVLAGFLTGVGCRSALACLGQCWVFRSTPTGPSYSSLKFCAACQTRICRRWACRRWWCPASSCCTDSRRECPAR